MVTVRIKDINYEKEYCLKIILQDGAKITYDMKPKLVTARFKDLEDTKVFLQGKVVESGRMIRWNTNTEISIEEILMQAKAVQE